MLDWDVLAEIMCHNVNPTVSLPTINEEPARVTYPAVADSLPILPPIMKPAAVGGDNDPPAIVALPILPTINEQAAAARVTYPTAIEQPATNPLPVLPSIVIIGASNQSTQPTPPTSSNTAEFDTVVAQLKAVHERRSAIRREELELEEKREQLREKKNVAFNEQLTLEKQLRRLTVKNRLEKENESDKFYIIQILRCMI